MRRIRRGSSDHGHGRFGIAVWASMVVTAWLAAGSARADFVTLLHPGADASVLSEENSRDTNYGALPQIFVWANYPVFGARAYLRFDLSSLPVGETVTFARLNVFQWSGGGFASGIDVYRVPDDSWQEGAITWNAQPFVGEPPSADRIVSNPAFDGNVRGWVSFDLLQSGVYDPSLDLSPGDGQLSLLLRISGGEVVTQRVHNLCSREAGPADCLIVPGETELHPGRSAQLVIGTPEPGIAAALASGVLASSALFARRSRRE